MSRSQFLAPRSVRVAADKMGAGICHKWQRRPRPLVPSSRSLFSPRRPRRSHRPRRASTVFISSTLPPPIIPSTTGLMASEAVAIARRPKANAPPDGGREFLDRLAAGELQERTSKRPGAAVGRGACCASRAVEGRPLHKAEVFRKSRDQYHRLIWKMEAASAR